jgi:hypothetical protein
VIEVQGKLSALLEQFATDSAPDESPLCQPPVRQIGLPIR